MFKACLLANRTCVHTYGQVRARSMWNTDRRVLFCGGMLANRPHYLLQVVTMIWDAVGYISKSISTLVCGISVIGTIYHIGCKDTERNCKFSYHIRNGTKLLTPNIVMYIILYSLHVFQENLLPKLKVQKSSYQMLKHTRWWMNLKIIIFKYILVVILDVL